MVTVFMMPCQKPMKAGYNLPLSGSALITIGGQKNKEKMLSPISLINSMKFNILATEHTAEFIKNNITTNVQELYTRLASL